MSIFLYALLILNPQLGGRGQFLTLLVAWFGQNGHPTIRCYEFISKCVLLLFARTAMWSMPVVLTETENENDSANQISLQKRHCKNDVAGPNNVVCRRHNLRLLI